MASLDEYNTLQSPAAKRDYLARLSASDRNNLLAQMGGTAAVGSWTRNEMAIIIVLTILCPASMFLFFIASQSRPGAYKQGFTVLTVGFVALLIYVVLIVFLVYAGYLPL